MLKMKMLKTLIVISFYVSLVYSYHPIDRVASKAHFTQTDLTTVIEKMVEQSKESSVPLLQVNAIFFLTRRTTGEKSILVNVENVGKNEDFYLITREKTYLISDFAHDVTSLYQILYYVVNHVDMDMTGLSLFGLEDLFQNEKNKNHYLYQLAYQIINFLHII